MWIKPIILISLIDNAYIRQSFIFKDLREVVGLIISPSHNAFAALPRNIRFWLQPSLSMSVLILGSKVLWLDICKLDGEKPCAHISLGFRSVWVLEIRQKGSFFYFFNGIFHFD